MNSEEKLSNEGRSELLARWKKLRDEITIGGESAATRVQLANVHLKLGEREEAINSLRIALSLRPETPSILARLKEICTEEEFSNLDLSPKKKKSRIQRESLFRKAPEASYKFRRDAVSFLIAGVAIIFATYFFWNIQDSKWHFLDGVDLIIHEAGHPIFSIFGEFIGIAGGTIMQLIVPLAFIVYFAFTKRFFSAAIVTFWLGQSILNVHVYAADAIKMELPLVGGNIHDWNYLLSHTNLLQKTDLVAGIIRATGIIALSMATIAGLITSFYRRID